MIYTLMHKNISVAELDIDNVTAGIIKVADLHSPQHLPIGIKRQGNEACRKALNDWWTGRSIPASRSGLYDALERLNITAPTELLVKCYGLSLSDQYWVNPKDSPLKYSQINFFENTFSEDVGMALFGEVIANDAVSLLSPDNTSDGWLKKKWLIMGGKRILLKAGSAPFHQEPQNEVLGSAIMRRLGIPFVEYTLAKDTEIPYSLCDDFITVDTDLVSAYQIQQISVRDNHISKYDHFINCCEQFGISETEDFLNGILTIDYLIANTDRHLSNFGAVRSADTLKFIGFAPIYDSGTSMWHNVPTGLISKTGKLESRPFRSTHDNQIKLVTNFDRFCLNNLNGIEDEWNEILKQSKFIDDDRRSALCKALSMRIEMLSDFINKFERKNNFTMGMVFP